MRKRKEKIVHAFPLKEFASVGDSDCGQSTPFFYEDSATAVEEAIDKSDAGVATIAEYKLVRVFRAKVARSTTVVEE